MPQMIGCSTFVTSFFITGANLALSSNCRVVPESQHLDDGIPFEKSTLQEYFLLDDKMVKDYVSSVSSFFNDFVDFLPPGLFLSLAASNVANGKYFDVYVKEFVGTMLMIVFTFSAGKWVGQDSWEAAWIFHAIGVVLADYFGGGQQVNPAVTMSIWALGKCDYTEAFVRVAGQMGGGLISFPLYHALSEAMKWTPFGGPQFNMENNAEAAISEFLASFLLMWVIYIVSFRVN